MPPHRIDPRIDPAPNSSPPATQHPREAGEGQPCAQLPQVLRLCWDCSPLLCCERHGQPSAEVGLPRHVLGLQQAADDLGLESCQLCWDVHKGYFFFFGVEESLHAHRCQSYQQPERQIKQT